MRTRYLSSVLLSILLATALISLLSLSSISQTASASPTPGVWENLTPTAPWPGTAAYPAVACYAENASGAKFIYTLESKSTPNLHRFDIAAGTWSAALASIGVTTAAGSGMVWTGGDNIYANVGASATPNFKRYSISANTWTTLAGLSFGQSSGSSLAWDGGDNIYGVFRAPSANAYENSLMVYSISANTWTKLYNMPFGTSPPGPTTGGNLCRVGENLYYANGYLAGVYPYWAYKIADNTWARLADAPGFASGAGPEKVSQKFIYAVRGGTYNWFFRFSIPENKWVTMENLPDTVGSYAGDRLAFDGTYLYLVRTTDKQFWRYEVKTYGVDVSISPDNQEGLPGQTLTYTVTVTNNGNATENFDLTDNDNEGWNPWVWPTVLTDIAPSGGIGTATLSVTIPKDATGCTLDNIWVQATSQGDTCTKDNYSVTAHVREYFEKYCMPDLGQHCVNWCWDAAAANSIYWYSQHGYPELIDDPIDPTPNDGRYITDPLRPCLGCPFGYYRLLDEIASDCGHVYCEGILDPEYFFGLQKFINDQGAPLVVHEIVDNNLVIPAPPEDGITVIYRPPTLEDYKRELERCQDVLLWLNYRHTDHEYEDTDHVVTGVGFSYDNQWIYVSDPWTPGAPDHSNDLLHETTPYDYLQVMSAPNENLWVLYAGIPVQVTKMVYISPEAAPFCGVEVTIENKIQEGEPCTWLKFDVIVHNTGNYEDNFHVSVLPDGWPMENIIIEPEQLENIRPCENKVAVLRVHIPDWAEDCTYKEIVVVASSKTCGASDNDNALIHVVVPPPPPENWFEKVCMPDLGQHAANWCWVGSVANCLWWFAQNGYLELLDDPLVLPDNDNAYITQMVAAPDGCLIYRLFSEIAADCGGGWNTPVTDNNLFYGLKKFIKDQGLENKLEVHEIITPGYPPMGKYPIEGPNPPETENGIVMGIPTFDNYKRELLRCQDVLLVVDWDCAPINHMVTGVGFYDNENVAGDEWIRVSDPWTTGAPDHNNIKDNKVYDNCRVVSKDPFRITIQGRGANVVKMIYISPIVPLWTGTVTITLENLYAVTIDLDGDVSDGENLVAKFYTYGGGKYQDQTVVCSENIPGHVTLLENVSRPGKNAIQRVELVLVNSENNDLWTLKVFEASRTILMGRLSEIDLIWPFASLDARTQLMGELSDIDLIWPFAPLTFEDP